MAVKHTLTPIALRALVAPSAGHPQRTARLFLTKGLGYGCLRLVGAYELRGTILARTPLNNPLACETPGRGRAPRADQDECGDQCHPQESGQGGGQWQEEVQERKHGDHESR